MQTKRYKAICAYDGSSFVGWQRQVTGESVQSALEDVLTRMHKHPVKVIGSGRTDRGVNALGQVFHFDSNLRLDIETYRHALNAQLNDSIYIRDLCIVDSSFHARKDAKYKVYQYRIYQKEKNIFLRNQVFFFDKELDVENMKKAASYFVGTHDFASFNTNTFVETPNQVRTLYDIKIEQSETELQLTFFGSGFLRYMVRMMTQTLIEVGTHKISAETVLEILNAKDKSLVSYLAKPQGLTLVSVHYERFDCQSLK